MIMPNKSLCFFAICCWNLITAIDATVLSVALPTIASDLHATSVATYWTGTAFVLCSAIFQPIFASLAGISEKLVVLVALGLFFIGSLIAALAQNIATLIAGRCLQGVGGGGLLVMTYVLIAHFYTLEQRAKHFSVIGLIWTVGTVIAPVIGGGFAGANWRWIFWLNLPIVGLCFVLASLFLRLEPKSQFELNQRLGAVDWMGIATLSSSLTLFLVAISWAGVMYPWASAATLVPLLLGVAGLVAWSLYSYKISSKPMIPLVILNDRTAAISYCGSLIQGLTQFALLYNLPLYYEGVKGYSATIAGVALLPQLLTSGPMTLLAGLLIARTGNTKSFNIIGWTTYAYGFLVITLLGVDTSIYHWIVLNVPSGIGLGILFSSLTIAAQASAENRSNCPAEEQKLVRTMSAGLTPFFRAVGQAIGIAIGQTAFSNSVSMSLGPDESHDAAVLVGEMREASVVADRERLATAFIEGLQTVWWILLALAFCMFVLTLLTRNHSIKAAKTPGNDMEEVLVVSDGVSDVTQEKREDVI